MSTKKQASKRLLESEGKHGKGEKTGGHQGRGRVHGRIRAEIYKSMY